MRWFFVAGALVSACVALNRIVSPWSDADLYERDFLQEHVTALAVRDGVDPYLPLPELAAKSLPDAKSLPWNHPCPHPPPAILAFMPVGLLPYRLGKIVWLLFELGCLTASIELILRALSRRISWQVKAVALLGCLSAGPVLRELWHGQFSAILLLLSTLAWRQLRAGKDVTGGLWLGLSIALKWAAWPIGLFLLLRRRWSAVALCGAVVVGANALGVALLGQDTVVRYYTVVGPKIARDNRQHMENYSFWSVGSRFFAPEPIEGGGGYVTQPIMANLAMEKAVTYTLPVTMLVLAFILARRCRSFDSSYGILLLAGLPINPVVWDHYLLLTILPIAICLDRLVRRGLTRATLTLVGIGLAVTIVSPQAYIDAAVRLFAVPDARYEYVLPFFPGLVTYLPLVPIAIWIGLLWITDADASG